VNKPLFWQPHGGVQEHSDSHQLAVQTKKTHRILGAPQTGNGPNTTCQILLCLDDIDTRGSISCDVPPHISSKAPKADSPFRRLLPTLKSPVRENTKYMCAGLAISKHFCPVGQHNRQPGLAGSCATSADICHTCYPRIHRHHVGRGAARAYLHSIFHIRRNDACRATPQWQWFHSHT
jgi:hypothetical protein